MDYKGAFFNTSDYDLIEGDIGKGVFGTVYVAKSKIDNQNYEVKILDCRDGFNGDQQMSLMRESMILRKLHHPSIVQFIGINFQSFKNKFKLEPSIITEYLPNGSLKDVLTKEKQKKSPTEWNATKKFISLLGIASAMKYLHQNKIIHRDLKPQNVLMDSNYYPHVCDFGLSRCLPDSYEQSMNSSMTDTVGTPLYMSPELFRGDTNYDESVDVFAFANLAYEIVTGKEPYYDLGNVTKFVLAKKVMDGSRPKFNGDANEKMINLLERCWSEKASDRPSFDEIYFSLSNDFSYFDQPINEEEVNKYIENNLNEVLKNSSYDPDEDFFQALASLHGDKKEKNINDAISTLQFSSEKGSSLSSYLLGLLHQSGEGLDIDFEKAENYFKKSAAQKNSNGFQRLGVCYTFGYGVEKDYDKAFEFYKKSAEFGNSRALMNLGQCYKHGYGVDKDINKAYEYINKSADLGNAAALCNLAVCYKRGEGVEKNVNKAVEYSLKASERGSSSALFNVGNWYEFGKDGVEQDLTKAAQYYQKGAEQGHPSCQLNLGFLLKNGKGVPKDTAKAAEWFGKASLNGSPKAMFNLGHCYEKGEGVEQNLSKAIELYEKSAALGNLSAQSALKKLKK